MRVPHSEAAGPPIINSRARLVTVKTPRTARPRRRRADGLDSANDEPRLASIDGPAEPWHRGVHPAVLAERAATARATCAPAIVVTIGQQTRVFHAFVTSAPIQCDAPSTVTLYASTWADVAGLAADEIYVGPAIRRLPARLVLVDAMELVWQRARCREEGHRVLPADSRFVGVTALQGWLWRRVLGSSLPSDGEVDAHGADSPAR
jgi:hypothetical protein